MARRLAVSSSEYKHRLIKSGGDLKNMKFEKIIISKVKKNESNISATMSRVQDRIVR